MTAAEAEDARDVEDARFGALLALAFSDGSAAVREEVRRLEAIRDAA